MNKWTGEVKYDSQTEDYYLEFPPEMLTELGWETGDTLIWKDNKDGSFTISKKVDHSTGDTTTNETTHGTVKGGVVGHSSKQE
jgi:hypothetical protein